MSPPRSPRRPFLLALASPLVLAAQESPPAGAELAGTGRPGELSFTVRERGGGPIPARLTFVPEGGGAPELFPDAAAAPGEIAVRDNLLYSRSGTGRITVPPGRYRVIASRGPEWSLAEHALELAPGAEHELEFELAHELDTSGWIGADFRVPPFAAPVRGGHPGDGAAHREERLLACLGEGLEFVVASDLDPHPDHGPVLDALGLASRLASAPGSVISTPFGHVGAFPLDPARAAVGSGITDARALFGALRAETSAHGVVPVLQLLHPRQDGLGWFTRAGLDPVTGTSSDPAWARDFDALEVVNGNHALGYRDPALAGRVDEGHSHSVLSDWFHLLDLGERYAAVGNSGAHPERASVAGYPRNFVRSASDEPGALRPGAVAEAVRAGQLFTTTGPFVEYSVEGTPMGGTARAADGHARLAVRVRAASWVDCDRALVFVNGALVATVPVPDTRAALRLETELELCLLDACPRHARTRPQAAPFDAWVVVVVEGDDALVPVLDPDARPLAIGNPVWIEGDGDGSWTSPRARIAAALSAQATPDIARGWFARLRPEEQTHALALVARGPFAAALLEPGLASSARDVRLAAVRACERVGAAGTLPGVQRVWNENRDDPYLGALLLRVLAGARPDQAAASLSAYAARFGQGSLARYAHELVPLLAGQDVEVWQVLGPLAAAGAAPHPEPPPVDGDSSGPWRALGPLAPDGYADLGHLAAEGTAPALVYAQAFLRTDEARSIVCAFGSDGGGRVWLGRRLLYESRAPRRASPLETLLTLELEPGWNRLLLALENGSGASGFYFRLLAADVEVAASPR